MLNTYNSYNPPHLPDANIWLNLDPNTIALTGTSVNQWGDNLSGLTFGQSSAAKKHITILMYLLMEAII